MSMGIYQQLAMRTSTDEHDRVMNGCLGLIGESGEIVDIVKKWSFQSGDDAKLPTEKLLDECGDVLWYCAELATGLGANLYELYMTYQEDFYRDVHNMNCAASLEIVAGRLAAAAVRPFLEKYDSTVDESITAEAAWQRSQIKVEIVGIMVMIQDILTKFCDKTLEDAMDHNISKLRKRYPDGFDPERSLNRTV